MISWTQEESISKQVDKYLKDNNLDEMSKFPVFEFKEDGVHVDLLNSGFGYLGHSSHVISYEEFNKFIGQGIPDVDKIVAWDSLAPNDNLSYTFEFPPDTVEWTNVGGRITVLEKIGGGGFPVIEAINFEGQEVKIPSDYGSVYAVEVEWKNRNHNSRLKDSVTINSVKKFTGMMFQLRQDNDFIEVSYLTDYLRHVIEQSNMTFGEYRMQGLDLFFANMLPYEHHKEFLEELKRTRRDKNGINWEGLR